MAPSTCVESVRCRQGQEGIEEALLSLSRDEPSAEFAEDGMMQAWIGQFEPAQIFPVNATAHGLRRLAIREIFGTLEDRGKAQVRRRFGGLAARWEEGSKLRVLIELAELIGDPDVDIATRKGGAGDALGVFRDGVGLLGMQGHGVSSFPGA